MTSGKVWLVGAGPGDIGLFTLKGEAVLQQADVVVYDSLVGEGVLARIPEHARLINVGKRASHHTMVQEDINKVLLEEAQKGNKVVRLKGGDPYVFGRGGEELEELAAEVQNRRYARIALERLFAAGVLTEVQKRRFRLHVFRGLSTRQIGRLEGTSHQAVAKSLNLAIEKLKKFFAEQG